MKYKLNSNYNLENMNTDFLNDNINSLKLILNELFKYINEVRITLS